MSNGATQNVAANGAVLYSASTVDTGVSISPNPASGALTLKNAGLYLVLFNAVINTGATAGTIVPQLTANGVAVPGASATVTATTTATTANVVIPYLVAVGGSCCNVDNDITVSIVNAGSIAAAFTSASLSAIKLA